jgi:hypothetical protein
VTVQTTSIRRRRRRRRRRREGNFNIIVLSSIVVLPAKNSYSATAQNTAKNASAAARQSHDVVQYGTMHQRRWSNK